MHFYDARPTSPYAGVSQDYVSGNGDMTPLANTGPYGADAVTLRGQDGSVLPVAVLRPNWWGSRSGNILVHETMHYKYQQGDVELFKTLGALGFRPKSSYLDSAEITDWLDAGCPGAPVTRSPADRSGRHVW
jgi:hypothetical protein